MLTRTRQDIVSIAAAALALAIYPISAQGSDLASLTKVEINRAGDAVQLVFDRKVNPARIKIETFGEIIQLSLSETAVYPAKMVHSSSERVTKVFAYQYSPTLVRARISVRGSAEAYRDVTRLSALGKRIVASIGEPARTSTNARESAIDDVPRAKRAEATDEPTKTDALSSAERSAERSLLERVMGAADPKPEVRPEPKSSTKPVGEPTARDTSASSKLGGRTEGPGAARPLAIMTLFVAALAGVAWWVKRLSQGQRLSRVEQALRGALGRISPELGGRIKRGRLIEMVANHYLGPKKSIAVVRIQGRLLVVGITNENINLISELNEEGELENAVESAIDARALLGTKPSTPTQVSASVGPRQSVAPRGSLASAGPVVPGAVASTDAFDVALANSLVRDRVERSQAAPGSSPTPSGSVRDRIRSKLEGLKQL